MVKKRKRNRAQRGGTTGNTGSSRLMEEGRRRAERRMQWSLQAALAQAIQQREPLDDVMSIINQDPTVVQLLVDKYEGNYPLHAACMEWRYGPVIMKLVDLYPEALQKQNAKGDYPLHIACSHKDSEDVILTLIELFPEASRQKNYSDDYPLHFACRHHLDRVIFKLIEMYPEALRQKNSLGYHPLHIACDCDDQSEQVILKLIDMFPEAVSIGRNDTDYPLHFACDSIRSITVIRKLLEIDPSVLRRRNYKSWYPIHCAIWNNSHEISKLLLEADPLVWQESDVHDTTLFHFACRLGEAAMVEYLLERYDFEINSRSNRMETALHYACDVGSEENVAVLLKNPDIDVNATDCRQDTALHVITGGLCSGVWYPRLPIIQLLLDHPFIIVDHKNHDNKTPLDMINKQLYEIENHEYHDDGGANKLASYQEMKRLFEEFPFRHRCRSYDYFFHSWEG